jgi:hypothetical protein
MVKVDADVFAPPNSTDGRNQSNSGIGLNQLLSSQSAAVKPALSVNQYSEFRLLEVES